MKFLYKYLNKYLSGNSKEETTANTDTSNYNYVSYLIDKDDNEPYIKMNIQDLSDEAAKNFGEMLFYIGNGFYQESLLNILVDFSKRDEKINAFVLDTIKHWYALSDTHQKNKILIIDKPWLKAPQISPLDFNKNAK